MGLEELREGVKIGWRKGGGAVGRVGREGGSGRFLGC